MGVLEPGVPGGTLGPLPGNPPPLLLPSLAVARGAWSGGAWSVAAAAARRSFLLAWQRVAWDIAARRRRCTSVGMAVQ